jgi:hypothetical protein
VLFWLFYEKLFSVDDWITFLVTRLAVGNCIGNRKKYLSLFLFFFDGGKETKGHFD